MAGRSPGEVNLSCLIFFSLHAPPCQPLMKCKRVFQALITIAIEELCHMANALIVPVRMGVARPTAPFALVSINSDAVQVT